MRLGRCLFADGRAGGRGNPNHIDKAVNNSHPKALESTATAQVADPADTSGPVNISTHLRSRREIRDIGYCYRRGGRRSRNR